MSDTETNRTLEALLDRGLNRFGCNVTPNPLKRAGFEDADDVQLTNERHMAKIAGQKPPKKLEDGKPFTLADAKAMAEQTRKAFAHVERHPPADVANLNSEGKSTKVIPKAQSEPLFAWVRKVGLKEASAVSGINYHTLRKALQRDSCGSNIAKRLSPHVTSH